MNKNTIINPKNGTRIEELDLDPGQALVVSRAVALDAADRWRFLQVVDGVLADGETEVIEREEEPLPKEELARQAAKSRRNVEEDGEEEEEEGDEEEEAAKEKEEDEGPNLLEDRTRVELLELAREMELSGVSKLNKDELLAAIREAAEAGQAEAA